MSRSKILVTGGAGFVGRQLCESLLGHGKPTNIVVSTNSYRKEKTTNVIALNINESTDWSLALENVKVVIHLAARVHIMNDGASNPLAEYRKVNVEGTLNLAKQAAIAGVKRFIFLSSVKVNGESTIVGKPFSETDIPNPQDAYGISKLEAEQGLLIIAKQTGMEVVIIRPPLVYGPRVKANFASVLSVVKRGIPLPLGAVHNKRGFVYIDNLVSLIVRCIDHPAAANQVFLVSDGRDLSTAELLRACADALGVKSRLLPIPQKLIEIAAALFGKTQVAQRLCGNLQLEITKARTLLDWEPSVSVEQGLKVTVSGLMEK